MDGFININKPPQMTSHDVVAIVRRSLPNRPKVGHTGTLDPQATGVLPICVGKATRLAEYFTQLPKTYIGELCLGIRTNTLDIWGEVLETRTVEGITEADLAAVLPKFTGKIQQIPPMVSALKVNGKKLYQLERAGVEVERAAREVEIFSLKVLATDLTAPNPKATLEICCSSGTYVRSLFADIGTSLGTVACMSALSRAAVGDFRLEQAITLEELQQQVEQQNFDFLLPYAAGISHLPRLTSDNWRLLHGLDQPLVGDAALGRGYSVFTSAGELLGIGEVTQTEQGKKLRLYKVLFESNKE